MRAIIAVIGGGTCSDGEAQAAEETGRLLAAQGAIVMCGGLGGVMEAVLIAIGGGAGTLSEIALAQRIGRPVVGLYDSFRNAVDIPRVDSAAAAVGWALERVRDSVV